MGSLETFVWTTNDNRQLGPGYLTFVHESQSLTRHHGFTPVTMHRAGFPLWFLASRLSRRGLVFWSSLLCCVRYRVDVIIVVFFLQPVAQDVRSPFW